MERRLRLVGVLILAHGMFQASTEHSWPRCGSKSECETLVACIWFLDCGCACKRLQVCASANMIAKLVQGFEAFVDDLCWFAGEPSSDTLSQFCHCCCSQLHYTYVCLC